MPRTLLGVAGFPVAHSRSPGMHNAALTRMGLDWLYLPLPLPPERFFETVLALPASGFRGLNVTVPHKLAAHEIATERTAAASAIGAANTLTFADDRIIADNTDGDGFLDALAVPPRAFRALVLGAGGSARAVIHALLEGGAREVSVWNRTAERAAALAAELGARHSERPEPADLLVNCTSVGLDSTITESQALEMLELEGYDPPAIVADLVYAAGPTPIARWAARAGARVVDGLEVLVFQGARSLEGWTARSIPVDTMRMAARGL